MPGPVSTTVFGTNSDKIPEILNPSIERLMPEEEEVFSELITSNQGVMGNDGIGRGMLIKRVYQGSLTGVIEGGGPTNDALLYGDALNSAVPGTAGSLGSRIHLQGQNFDGSPGAMTFPDPMKSPNDRPFSLSIPMRSMRGTLPMTLGEMTLEATPSVIGEIIAPKLAGFARNWAHTIALYWFMSQNSYYALTTVGSSVTRPTVPTGETSNSIVRFSPANYATARFVLGMRVNVYDTTGATQRVSDAGSGDFYVTRVDLLTNIVELRAKDGGAITISGWASTDIVVLANTKGSSSTPYAGSPYFTGIAGINSWLKTGDGSYTDNNVNCLLGDERVTDAAINVTAHPEFRSMGVNMNSQPLTEFKLGSILARWHAAKGPYGKTIDALVASDGVWRAYQQQKIAREVIDRTGKLASLQNEGAEKGFKIMVEGRTYKGYTSNRIETGSVYGHKFGGGNWKRITPPSPKGAKRMGGTPSFAPVEYVMPALTGGSATVSPVFRNVGNQSMVTEFTQMPVMLRMQLIPWNQPDGLKIINCAEDRTYGEFSV